MRKFTVKHTYSQIVVETYIVELDGPDPDEDFEDLAEDPFSFIDDLAPKETKTEIDYGVDDFEIEEVSVLDVISDALRESDA